MRPILVLALLLAVSFAGCTSDDAPAGTDDQAVDSEPDDSAPRDAASTAAFIEFPNAWEEGDQFVMHEHQHTGFNDFTPLAQVPCGSFGDEGMGCGYTIELDQRIPVGAMGIQFEASAGGFHQTDYRLQVKIGERESGEGWGDDTVDAQSEGQSASDLQLWMDVDAEHADQIVTVRLQAMGTGASMSSTFDLKATAHKDPDWVAPLIVDPWQDPANHTYTPEGSMVLLWDNATHAWGGYAQSNPLGLGGTAPKLALSTLVPHATSAILVGVRTTSVDGCAPDNDCRLSFHYHYGNDAVNGYDPHDSEDSGDEFTIRIFEPPYVRVDALTASESQTYVELVLNRCTAHSLTTDELYCGAEELLDARADASVLVEAWSGEPDLDAFKERLGV